MSDAGGAVLDSDSEYFFASVCKNYFHPFDIFF
jgi:hypothetical protein